MISDFLNKFELKNKNILVFFLKDFIYHSVYNNILLIPNELKTDLNSSDSIKLELVMAAIINLEDKEFLLNEINSFIYNQHKPNNKIENKAKQILKELSSNKNELETSEITFDLSNAITGITRAVSITERTGRKTELHPNMRKLLKRQHSLKRQGFKQPFVIRAYKRNEIILREITLENGVTVKLVIDKADFNKLNYQKPVISASVLNLIMKENR